MTFHLSFRFVSKRHKMCDAFYFSPILHRFVFLLFYGDNVIVSKDYNIFGFLELLTWIHLLPLKSSELTCLYVFLTVFTIVISDTKLQLKLHVMLCPALISHVVLSCWLLWTFQVYCIYMYLCSPLLRFVHWISPFMYSYNEHVLVFLLLHLFVLCSPWLEGKKSKYCQSSQP